MKKQFLLVAAAVGLTFATSAQELKNKDGFMILPETGDWALGFDANPLLDYAGNLFNGATGNSLNVDFVQGNANTLYGKYFLDANTALRGWLRLGTSSRTDTELVTDVTSTAMPPAQVEDVRKIGSSNVFIGAGYEKRKGHNRLQGYYGGDVMIGFGTNKVTYDYGNTLTSTNIAHNSSFGQTAGLLESKSGTTVRFGLRGVIGVEYFFAPKISLGAEYGWGLSLSSTGNGLSSTEAWNGTAAETTETETAGFSTFGIDNDISGGSIRLMFHF